MVGAGVLELVAAADATVVVGGVWPVVVGAGVVVMLLLEVVGACVVLLLEVGVEAVVVGREDVVVLLLLEVGVGAVVVEREDVVWPAPAWAAGVQHVDL